MINQKNIPQREREPELKEVLNSLENLSNRFDELTIKLKTKIQSIHNPPQLEPIDEPTDGEKTLKPQDMIGCINEQVSKLQNCGNRIESLLMLLHKII